ncbi:hypothetical protein EHI44_31475 [Rhizobium leguminosarum]|nr:hypothetical protein EHI44_31475 [Rhizobium leguminosarum]TAU80498.1 hypothetical protein ELI41_29790 [Rhizobium leguminosarum]TAV53059.1 hypothetical protein ELI29_08100 [Rhizobium leguminosarum]
MTKPPNPKPLLEDADKPGRSRSREPRSTAQPNDRPQNMTSAGTSSGWRIFTNANSSVPSLNGPNLMQH